MDRLERSWSDGSSNNVTEEGGRQQFRSKYEYKVNVESLPEKKGKVIKRVKHECEEVKQNDCTEDVPKLEFGFSIWNEITEAKG